MENEKDPLFRLKYMGYCLSNMPPDGADTDFEDFFRYAKFQLCLFYKRPVNDPIWETYSDEALLIEYYALIYNNIKEEREKFEAVLRGEDTEIVDWFDSQIEANKLELDKKYNLDTEILDDISFSPSDLG